MASTEPHHNWFFGGYTTEEISRIRHCFQKLRRSFEAIGINAFTRLFSENREAFQVFVEKDLMPAAPPDVHQIGPHFIADSPAAREHSVRVLLSVELCANKLDNEKAVADYLRALSGRHCGFGIKADHFLSLIGCLRLAYFDELKHVNESLVASGSCVANDASEPFKLDNLKACIVNIGESDNNDTTSEKSSINGSTKSITEETTRSCPSVSKHCKQSNSDGKHSCSRELLLAKFDDLDTAAYNDAISKEDMTALNKFFLTLSLAMINSLEVALNNRRNFHHNSKKYKNNHRPVFPFRQRSKQF